MNCLLQSFPRSFIELFFLQKRASLLTGRWVLEEVEAEMVGPDGLEFPHGRNVEGDGEEENRQDEEVCSLRRTTLNNNIYKSIILANWASIR